MTTPDHPGSEPGAARGPQDDPHGAQPGPQEPGAPAGPEQAPVQGAGQGQNGSWAPPAGAGWVGSPGEQPSGSAVSPPPPGADRQHRRGPGWVGVIVVALVAALLAGGLATAIGIATRTEPQVVAAPASSSSDPESSADPAQSVPLTAAVDWNTLAQRVQPSVVTIRVASQQKAGAGTGVVIDKLGHVLTNNHVATGAGQDAQIQVTLSDGRLYGADVVGLDPSTDLAVIQIRDAPEDLNPAVFGRSADVKVGQQVMAVGNPLGLSDTVTTGIVSALNRPVVTPVSGEETQDGTQGQAPVPNPFGDQRRPEGQPGGPGQQQSSPDVVTNAIQTDAAINPGNSGGPLVDVTGRVIGINSSIASLSSGESQAGSVGLGFAIPADEAKRVSTQLVTDGVATHAQLGVTLGGGSGVATADGTSRQSATVAAVTPDSPAAQAGLLVGDEIIAADDVPTPGTESLVAIVRQHAPGDRVTLTLVRNGQEEEVTVELGSQEDQ